MASTSPVRLLRAMTVGSLRTMPRDRSYTSVFAVPRSMARSRARASSRSALARVTLGRQRLHLTLKRLHARTHALRLVIHHREDQRADDDHCERNDEEEENAHGRASPPYFLRDRSRGHQFLCVAAPRLAAVPHLVLPDGD